MTLRLFLGEGRWPAAMALRHALRDRDGRPRVVLDLQGRGAASVPMEHRAALQNTVWIDAARRSNPQRLWSYRSGSANDRALRDLLSGIGRVMGVGLAVEELDAIVRVARETVESAGPSTTGASAELGLVALHGLLRRPETALRLRADEAAAWRSDPSRLALFLDALSAALRYVGVFAGTEATPGPTPESSALLWLEVPRDHLEEVEWRLVSLLAIARARSLCGDHAKSVVVALHPAGAEALAGVGGLVDVAAEVTVASVANGGSPPAALAGWSKLDPQWCVGRVRGAKVDAWRDLVPREVATKLASLGEQEAFFGVGGPEPMWERRRLAAFTLPAEPLRLAKAGEQVARHLAEAARDAVHRAQPREHLLDRLSATSSLQRAWQRVRTGAADSHGADMVTIRTFSWSADAEIDRLSNELRAESYRPLPLRRVFIPKTDGGRRPIGMVAVRDRIAQSACLDVLDPLFDPGFSEHSYAYRLRRGAPPAVLAARDAARGRASRWFLKCDIEKCFDSVDHEILLSRVAERIEDAGVMRLLGLWSRAEILFGGDLIASEVGVPQGSNLAPFLCNVYLSTLDQTLEQAGYTFMRYADDILVAAETEVAAREAHGLIQRTLANQLRMRLNPSKTAMVPVAQGIGFLGFFIDHEGLHVEPAKLDGLLEDVRRQVAAVQRARGEGGEAVSEAIEGLVATLRGFSAYYRSVGAQAAITDELTAAGRVITSIVDESLPANVRAHAIWQSREAIWRGERDPSAPAVDRPPRGTYPERSAPAVKVPTSAEDAPATPAVQRPAEDPASLARGVLFEGGHLTVLRHGAYLILREDRLVVRVRGGDVAAPDLGSIKTVMVSGLGTGVSSALARWLSRAEVPLVLASPMDTDVSVLASPHAGSPRVRFGQALHARAVPVCKAGLAMLDAKVNGQASLLRYYAKYRRRCGDALHESLDETAKAMRSIAEKIVAIDPGEWDRARKSAMGYEGAAAAAYWSAVARMVPSELEFPGRRTRGAQDPVNQSLNYVYGCLYAEVWRAVSIAGLDPCVGIIHGSDRGDASLVFDLVEELRPAFGDRLVLSLLGRGFRPSISARDVLSTASRRTLSRAFRTAAVRPIRWRGKKMTFERLVQSQARQLAAICRDGVGRYLAFHLRW